MKKILFPILIFANFANAQVLNVYTVAGNGSGAGFPLYGDGNIATSANLNNPFGLDFDNAGNLYIADYGHSKVRKVDAVTGIISTIAGTGTIGYSGDGGPATSAMLYYPASLVVDDTGNVYVSDMWNYRIRKISTTGIITTYAGTGVQGFSGDGGLATSAKISYAQGMVFDNDGNLYFWDDANYRLRKITPSGIITTIAGNGSFGFSGDGGPALSAKFNGVTGLGFDSGGNIYLSDMANGRIRKIDTFGIVTTICGDGSYGFSGDGGLAINAQLNNPGYLEVDQFDNIYFGDQLNYRIRKISPSGIITTVAGNGATTFNGDGGLADTTVISYAHGFAFAPDGTLYFSDGSYQRVRKLDHPQCAPNPSGNPVELHSYFPGTSVCADAYAFNFRLAHDPALPGPFSVYVNFGDGTDTTFTPVDCDWAYFTHQYPTSGSYSWIALGSSPGFTDTITGFANVNACGNITGAIYSDENSNCTLDTSDVNLSSIAIKISNGSTFFMAWTNATGTYSIDVPVGTYTIEVLPVYGYLVTCAGSTPHSITVTSSSILTEDFALDCNGFDVGVTGISLLSGFFPGQTDAIMPHVGIFNSVCSDTVSATVQVVLSPCLIYNPICPFGNTHPVPDAILPASTGDTLVFNFGSVDSLGFFDLGDYLTHVDVCTTAMVGDTACVQVIVTTGTPDVNLANNYYSECFVIGVSYDPNNKEVDLKGEGPEGFIPSTTQYLTYTLNFQNTGTAQAWNIYLLDTISTNLDLSSIEVLSASHSMETFLLPGRVMKFMFANIMLPDSTTNEEESHGYVTYRIKLNSGLLPGTEIENTGYIYFDYNEAVVTNTVLNTIAFPAGVQNIEELSGVLIYPNPANDLITIQLKQGSTASIELFDLIGNLVMTSQIGTKSVQIPVQNLANGVYSLVVKDEGQTSRAKFIVKH